MDYNMESFIQWCDDVTIAEEETIKEESKKVVEKIKNEAEKKENEITTFFNPTDLDRSDVKEVSTLTGLRNALFAKTPVIRVTGNIKEELAKEVQRRAAGNCISTVVKLAQIISGNYFMAALGLGVSAFATDPAWKNASYYSVVKTERGAIYLVYGNYIKKK